MARHRRWPLFALVLPGLALVAGSFVWDGAVAEDLVKYPEDIESTTAFEGTMTLYVDPATKAPYAEPQQLPLSISRHVYAVPGEADDTSLVIREDVTLGTPLFDSSQSHQYVVDRKTGENLTDARAWSYNPEHVADRAGAYRLLFGFDVPELDAWTIYKDETDGTYTAELATLGELQGVDTFELAASMPWTPVNEDYLAGLSAAVDLPRELTLEQLKPLLAGSGLDMDAVLLQIAGGVTPEDLQALLGIAGQPIPLEYMLQTNGTTAMNPITGVPVDVSSVAETVAVRPTAAWVSSLTDLLGKYPENEGAKTLTAALAGLSSEPTPVFSHQYAQTDESVAIQVADVKDSIAQKTLAEDTIPTGMLAAGASMVVIGFLLVAIPKKRGGSAKGVHAPSPAAPADAEEREPELV
jgi:hypothetical protein